MRKSTSRIRSRLAYAGLTTGALVGALLVAPQSAYAAPLTSVTPNAGPAGITVTATLTGAFAGVTTPGVILTTATTCPTTYSTTVTAPTLAFAATSPARVNDNSATFVVPTTATLNSGAARDYSVCIYNASTGTTALVHDAASPKTFTLTPTGTLSPTSGPSGGGNTITLTAPTGTTYPVAVYATFSAGGNTCPATYNSSGITATTVRTSATVATVTVPVGVAGALSAPTPYSVCLYSGNTNNTSPIVATSNTAGYSVALPAVSLNTAVGPAGTSTPAGPSITVTSPTNFLTGVTAPYAVLTSTACGATYPSSPTASTFAAMSKVANNRAAVKVPSAITSVGTTYNVCVYAGNTANTSRLLANAAYTVATPPDVTSVSPSAGPALGGNQITVSGTNFPTAVGSLQATLGGVPLLNIVPVDNTTFTATTPLHAAEQNVPLVVTTATGSDTLANAFDYTNAIEITPNTASNESASVWVAVKGVGFESMGVFDSGATGTARVWLVDGEDGSYDPTASNTTEYTVGPTAECGNVLVISGTELFCELNLADGLLDAEGALVGTDPVPDGTYTLTVVSDGAVGATGYSETVISSGSTFTVADF